MIRGSARPPTRGSLWIVLVAGSGVLLGAERCETTEGDVPVSASTPHPIYESGDLGSIVVAGASTQAQCRFSLGADEVLEAVVVEGESAPYESATSTASVEGLVFDTFADEDPSNDVLAGQLPLSSPLCRVTLSPDQPGRFSIRIPVGTAAAEKLTVFGRTWSVRVRISTASWHGTILQWNIRALARKASRSTPVPGSFLRDS